MNIIEILTYNKVRVLIHNEFHEEFARKVDYNDEQMGFLFDSDLAKCITSIRAAGYTEALHYEFTDR